METTWVRINERYVIEKELGRGGLGIVYLAHDIRLLSRPVVIKTMLEAPDRTLDDPWFREKFEKEIEALILINHPGVVGVFDVGQMPGGKPFFVMQYVEGENLRSAMRGQRMALKRTAHIIRQLSFALSAAHEMNITHRDLKPENVMLQALRSGEEIVKLIDFGIASVKDAQARQSAHKTRVTGTIPYAAPEQLRGEPTPASDIWSLGVLAYEMVTGRLPFPTNDVLVLADMQRAGVSAAPKELRPELPAAAQEVILKALNYDPALRYPHAHDMGEAFLHAILQTGETTLPIDKRPPSDPPPRTPEDGHVLFMDLVGFTLLPMSEQVNLFNKLSEVVRRTTEFQRADSGHQLISLPTGDGLALVFFQNPVAHVQCALAVARELKAHPHIRLRMGLHSGPVSRERDINAHINVVGGGINLAQRVMDSGDAGHILLSRTVADNLIQLGDWQPHLHDLGQHEVKHGVRLHLFNLCKGELGCPSWPTKLGTKQGAGTFTELLLSCQKLFKSFGEFRSPDTLRHLFHTPEMEPFERCLGWAANIEYDQLLDCLSRSGRQYRGEALVDLLGLLASRYKDDLAGRECEGLRDSLRQLFTQPPASGR